MEGRATLDRLDFGACIFLVQMAAAAASLPAVAADEPCPAAQRDATQAPARQSQATPSQRRR